MKKTRIKSGILGDVARSFAEKTMESEVKTTGEEKRKLSLEIYNRLLGDSLEHLPKIHPSFYVYMRNLEVVVQYMNNKVVELQFDNTLAVPSYSRLYTDDKTIEPLVVEYIAVCKKRDSVFYNKKNLAWDIEQYLRGYRYVEDIPQEDLREIVATKMNVITATQNTPSLVFENIMSKYTSPGEQNG